MTIRISVRRWTVLCSAFLMTQTATADLTHYQLKGVDSLLTPECSHLSPAQGFTALKTGILPNIRFNGPYREKKAPYGCHPQIRGEDQKTDCPQDWTTALIQQLFPSPDGQNFVANQRMGDFLSHISMKTLGRLLSWIDYATPNIKDGSHEMDDVWREGVFTAFYPEIVKENEGKLNQIPAQMRKAQTTKDMTEKQLDQCKHDISKADLIPKLEKDLEQITQRLEGLNRPKSLVDLSKESPRWQELEGFSRILFEAIQENQNLHSTDQKPIYPKHIMEHTLLAYAWMKATQKEDILKLIQNLPERCLSAESRDWILQSQTLKTSSKEKKTKEDREALKKVKTDWLNATYNDEDYRKWTQSFHKSRPTEKQKEELFSNPELAAFYSYSYEIIENPMPPNAGYKKATHKSLPRTKGSRKYENYSDCGETSLRNFFNIILYNQETRKFDSSILEKLIQEKGLKPYFDKGKKNEKGLLAFYQGRNEIDPKTKSVRRSLINSDPAYVDDQKVHDDWSRRVVSALPKVRYLRGNGQCEIDAGFTNMFEVIGALLGDDKLNQLKKLDEKLDHLCELLSRDEFELDWNLKDGNKKLEDDTGTLEFTINGQKTFTWTATSGHFSVEPIDAENNFDWRQGIAPPLQSKKDTLQPWFIHSNPITEAYKKWPDLSLYWLMPLKNNDRKPDFIRHVIENHHQAAYPMAKAWIRKMPATDPNAQIEILDALALTPSDEQANHYFISEWKHAMTLLDQNRQNSLKLIAEKCATGALRDLEPTVEELYETPYGKARLNLIDIALKNTSDTTQSNKCWNFIRSIGEKNPELLIQPNHNGSIAISAAEAGKWDLVQFILKKVPSDAQDTVGYEDGYGDSIAFLAAEHEQFETLNLLNEHHHASFIKKSGKILKFALQNRKAKLFTYIIDKNPLLLENEIQHAYMAAKNGSREQLKFLHQRNPAILKSVYMDSTITHIAASKSEQEILEYILEAEPERFLDQSQYWKKTPLNLLVENKNWEMIRRVAERLPAALQALKEKSSKKTTYQGKTLLEIAQTTYHSRMNNEEEDPSELEDLKWIIENVK